MNRKRHVSIELFRDRETPDISLDPAIEALTELQQIVQPLKIINRKRKLKLSESGTDFIETKNVPVLNIQADFGIIFTSRYLVVPDVEWSQMSEDRISIGRTWLLGKNKPFSIIDAARAGSPKISTMHEAGHLLQVPRSGEDFDGDCHCNRPDCIMHHVYSSEQEAYCNSCTDQLAQSAFKLINI